MTDERVERLKKIKDGANLFLRPADKKWLIDEICRLQSENRRLANALSHCDFAIQELKRFQAKDAP